eukprot:scaffold12535_cov98-Cylindrotheca_fusiformis.AAC.2
MDQAMIQYYQNGIEIFNSSLPAWGAAKEILRFLLGVQQRRKKPLLYPVVMIGTIHPGKNRAYNVELILHCSNAKPKISVDISLFQHPSPRSSLHHILMSLDRSLVRSVCTVRDGVRNKGVKPKGVPIRLSDSRVVLVIAAY